MSDNNNTERNGQLMRIMTIVGFVVLICLLAWLAVQVVRFVPVVFSYVANVFEENQREYALNTGNSESGEVVEDNDNSAPGSSQEEETIKEAETETDVNNGTSTSTTPAPVAKKPAPQPIQYKTVVTYKKPVSDPNGLVDLNMTFVGVGSLNSSQRFVLGKLPEKGQGAIQFTVKNIGTKTSSDWTFKLDLPNGSTMTSSVQKPLQPNESSTLTVVFEMDNDWHNTSGVVVGGGDINTGNNGFNAKVAKR